MTSLVDAVLCAVGIPILSYLELTDIVNNVTYTNKFLEVIAEQLCKQRLQSLNYFWIAADQIDFDCPVRRRGHFKRLLTLVTRKGAIIVGGNLDSRRCKFFSPKTRRFSTMNYMNVKGDTTNSTAVWHRGRIFVFSCNFESSLGSLEIYNPVLETWSKGAQGLPMIIKSSAAASCENALYVLGGDNYCKPQWKKSDRIFLLSNEENEQQFHWIKLSASLLRGRMFHAAVSYKRKIWIAGGLLEKRTGDAYNDLCTRSVEIFDPASGTVVQGPEMLHTRFQSTLAVVGGSLWVIGGDVHQTERTVGTIEKYNEETSLWEMITTFPKRREGCAICAVDSLIYVFGGCVGCQSFNDWDAYNVETDRWLSQDDINPIDLALCKINVDDSKGIKSCSTNSTGTDNSINSNNNSNTNPDINRTKNSDYTSNSNTNSNNVSGVNGSNRPTMNSIIPPHLRNQSQSRLLFPIVACPARNSMSMLNGATAVTTCSS